MPPDMAIPSMRHSKLKPEEAALLAGEITKPSWESRNEGIHERVSFEDSIWGFDLAGGSYYKTPLRVTAVKAGSRADKAGIRPGDKLKRINDIDTSTLTIQEAHEIIIESGIYLKIAVTAPEDEEDSYFCYQDPIDDQGYDSEEERRKEAEKAKKRVVHARVSSYWSLQWPWVSKRRVIYRESNCFMVQSKFEEKHRDKFPLQPILRVEDDIVLQSTKSEQELAKEKANETKNEAVVNGSYEITKHSVEKSIEDVNGTTTVNASENSDEPLLNGELENTDKIDAGTETGLNDVANGVPEENAYNELNGMANGASEDENSSLKEDVSISQSEDLAEEPNSVNDASIADDEIINEVLNGDDSLLKGDETNILDSILSDGDDHNLETTDKANDR